MTGNVVLMAFALTGTPELSLLRSALALLTALAGAVVAGHLDSRIQWEKRTSWLSITLVIEAAVLAIAPLVAWSGRAHLAEEHRVRCYRSNGLCHGSPQLHGSQAWCPGPDDYGPNIDSRQPGL